MTQSLWNKKAIALAVATACFVLIVLLTRVTLEPAKLTVMTAQPIFSNSNAQTYAERHWNPRNYNASLEPDILCTNTTTWLILIITSPGGFERRQALRETILTPLSKLPHAKHAFLVGRHTNGTVNRKLIAEQAKHNDIIQGSFPDCYENLAIKSLYALHWAAWRCTNLTYLMKIDDDVFANYVVLDNYLKSLSSPSQTIIGAIFRNAYVIHDKVSKWRADDFYKDKFYPTYASGPAYIISADLLRPLFRIAMTLPILRLEDVFITGLCAAKIAGVNFVEGGFIFNGPPADKLTPETVKTAHSYTAQDIRQLWKRIVSFS